MRVSKRPVSIGISSLFAVLIVLCLVIFAILAGITARAELDLAEKAALAVSAFYDAEERAVVRLLEQTESGEFTEKIDENRELFVRFEIVNDEVGIIEWAVVRKSSGATEDRPIFGTPPVF
jgi:hypothetical protein